MYRTLKSKNLHTTYEGFKESLLNEAEVPTTVNAEHERLKKEAWDIVAPILGFIFGRTQYNTPSLRDVMPFFSTLISKLKPVIIIDRRIKTMATDGSRVFISPNFIFKGANGQPLSQRQILFVYCHEILHNALGHFSRRGARNPKLWNYATDYEINPMLVANGLISKDELKTKIRGLYLDKYVGWAAEAIYSDLEEEIKKRQQNKQPPPPKPPKPQAQPPKPAAIGDYVKINGTDNYAKVTSVNGNEYEVEEVPVEEVRQAKKEGKLKKKA